MLNRPFDGPIPGESLTRAPKQFAWERPPEYVDPEDVLMFYLDKIMNVDTMEQLMDALEMGLPLSKLVQGILRTGVSEGIHTIDAGILVAPAIHEAIKGVAEDIGIEYEEGLEDIEAKKASKAIRKKLKTKARLRKLRKSDIDYLREEAGESEQMELPMDMPMEEPVEPPVKRGFMSREEI